MPCAIGKIQAPSSSFNTGTVLVQGFEYSSCVLPGYKIMGNNKISKHMDDSPLSPQYPAFKGSKWCLVDI